MNILVFKERNRCDLQKIYLESRKQVFSWQNSTLFTLNDFDRDTEGEAIWVATDNNRPIGFISVWKPDNFIHNLFIHPDFVGRGAGTKLLQVCLKEIGLPATLKCSKPNVKAKEFYLSKGWLVISEGEDIDGKYELMGIDKEI